MKREKLKIGRVFKDPNEKNLEYLLVGIYKDGVGLEKITQREKSSNRHGCGYGWIEDYYEYVRTMGKRELSLYQTHDPIIKLKKGIYKIIKPIWKILFNLFPSFRLKLTYYS